MTWNILGAWDLAATLPPTKESVPWSRKSRRIWEGRMLPLLVMERGGVYLQAGSPFWMIRFRYKGRLIRESSKTRSKREAIDFRKRRMAEFGLGKGVYGPEIPTLEEAAEALLAHIVAAKKRGRAQVRSPLRSLVAHFGSETRIAEILPDRMDLNVARSSAMKIAGHKTEAVYARYAIAPRASLASALQILANAEQKPPGANSHKLKRRK